MLVATASRLVAQATSQPTRLQVFILTALIWAGIFLPGLGSVELKHEEPRRALPAVHMLASGDWLVPRVGSIPYLRKPPMLQWLIALGFLATGGRSEWAVRLPSALATLALALCISGIGASWLGPKGGLLAAIFFLTNFAILESGRLAELEATYVAFSGIALVIWIAQWLRGAQGWSLWLLPGPFFAFAMLTKGPTYLVFFYGVVIPTLYFGKDIRSLAHPAHWCALAFIVGLFGAWALPCSFAAGHHDPVGVWKFWIYQIASRAGGSETGHFHVVPWLLSLPMTLKNFLPWTPLLLFLWWPGLGSSIAVEEASSASKGRKDAWFRGARLGTVVTCLLMSLLPEGSPRYLYPLFVVPCLLLSQVLTDDSASASIAGKILPFWKIANWSLLVLAAAGIVAVPFFTRMSLASWSSLIVCTLLLLFAWIARARVEADSPSRILSQAVITATIFMIAILIYGAAIVPRVNSLSHGAKEIATMIRAKLPPDAILWVQENEYRPFWYYLEPKVRYFLYTEVIPSDARYFIVPDRISSKFIADPRWTNTRFQQLSEIVDSEQKRLVLFERIGER